MNGGVCDCRARATADMAGSPATGEDATDYFFRTPGELGKSGLFDEKDHCGSKLKYGNGL